MQLLLMQPAQLEVFFPCPSADAEQRVTVSKHERMLSMKPWLVFLAGCCPWHLLICHLHRGHMAWECAHRKLQAAHTDALMRSRPYKVTCGHPRTGRGRSAAVDRPCGRGVLHMQPAKDLLLFYIG